MSKILDIHQTIKASERERKKEKKIVLVGGCFDIAHTGHIHFLGEAKKAGDILIVLLESDQAVRRLKGEKRPINTQEDRAFVLAALRPVDIVCLLPHLTENKEYDDLVFSLKPAIIATTEQDPYLEHKERQARLVDAKIKVVKKLGTEKSTSTIARILQIDSL